jgi:hypothetical protein
VPSPRTVSSAAKSIAHPDAGVETAPMPPRPDQQPDSATGRPQRSVVGQHPAEEEVVPAALQVHHRRHSNDVGAMVTGLPIRIVRGVTDPLLKPPHPPPGQRDIGVGDRQCGRRASHRPWADEHPEELIGRSTMSTKHPINDLYPAQRPKANPPPGYMN